MKYKAGEFEECKTCSKKPGSPTLCDSCLHNRKEISELNQYVRHLDNKLDIIKRVLDF